jgi:leucine dehydrogenase
VRRIGETLSDIFARADHDDVPTSVVADRLAQARFLQ